MTNVTHHRSYPPFEWPCLTSHLMMRLPAELDPVQEHDIELINGAHVDRINAINAAIEKFTRSRPDPSFSPFTPLREWFAPAPLAHTRDHRRHPNDSMCVPLPAFGHFRMGLIVEVMPEATSFSLRASPIEEGDIDEATQKLTDRAYTAINDLTQGDIVVPPSAVATPGEDVPAEKVHDDIFKHFWNSYFLHVAGAADEGAPSDRQRIFNGVGTIVIECQGVILKATANNEGVEQPESLESQIKEMARRRRAGGNSASQEVIPAAHSNLQAIQTSLRRFVNRRPEFCSRVLALRPDKVGVHADFEWSANSILCFLDGGFAIYGSSLHKSKHGVVRFFVVYGGVSRHQLSRVIMTLHHCGELRFASEFDMNQLAEASEMIRVLDLDLAASAAAPVDLDKFNNRSAWVSQLVRGGLSYRIGRLSQHRHLLDFVLSDLNVKPIEGWQSYESVVRRKVSRVLDDFVELGPRFERLQMRIRQQINFHTTAAIRERTQRLVALQNAGEIIAVLAGSYYLGSLLDAVGKASMHDVWAEQHKAGVFMFAVGAVVVTLNFMKWMQRKDPRGD